MEKQLNDIQQQSKQNTKSQASMISELQTKYQGKVSEVDKLKEAHQHQIGQIQQETASQIDGWNSKINQSNQTLMETEQALGQISKKYEITEESRKATEKQLLEALVARKDSALKINSLTAELSKQKEQVQLEVNKGRNELRELKKISQIKLMDLNSKLEDTNRKLAESEKSRQLIEGRSQGMIQDAQVLSQKVKQFNEIQEQNEQNAKSQAHMISELQRKYQGKVSAADQLTQDHQRKISQMQQRTASQIDEWTAKINQSNQMLAGTEQALGQVTARFEITNTALNQIQGDLETSQKELGELHLESESRIEGLIAQLNDAHSEIGNLEKQFESEKSASRSYKTQMSKLKQRLLGTLDQLETTSSDL